jgi:hypothetical protein
MKKRGGYKYSGSKTYKIYGVIPPRTLDFFFFEIYDDQNFLESF